MIARLILLQFLLLLKYFIARTWYAEITNTLSNSKRFHQIHIAKEPGQEQTFRAIYISIAFTTRDS